MRIGLVTDAPAAAEALRTALSLTAEHRVIWQASNGPEAVQCAEQDRPDLILLDPLLGGIGGVETTRRIMEATPCAILLVTADVRANAGRVFDAMGHGALDAVDTPIIAGGDVGVAASALLAKIATLSKLIRGTPPRIGASRREHAPAPRRDRLVAIGASAGGPAILAMILRHLPKDFPAPIVIAQHVDEQFAAGMALWLGQDSPLVVRVAKEGDQPHAGEVLIAATSDHLTMKSADSLGYTVEPRDYAYRPSVDVLFKSVSRLWRGDVVGVLLTGMGRDGALGLKALRDRGHYTIAQDAATSAVYGMPKAAADANAAVDILAAERIAPKLIEVVMSRI